jgi:hypothetical protein
LPNVGLKFTEAGISATTTLNFSDKATFRPSANFRFAGDPDVKVKLTHTRRAAFVYIRQSSPQQVENNRESTARQYALVERACELGWRFRFPWEAAG